MRAQATVAAILDATAHILGDVGYEGLSTNAVAARAGVSIGSLYQYFPSKEALVGELIDRECDRLNALFGEVFLRGQSSSPRQLAREVIGAVYRAKLENPRLAKVLREQMPNLGRLKRLEETLDQVRAAVERYLEEHRGALRVESTSRAAFFVVELAEHLTTVCAAKRAGDMEEAVVEEVVDVLYRYVFP